LWLRLKSVTRCTPYAALKSLAHILVAALKPLPD
jgi:hypothetical protein